MKLRRRGGCLKRRRLHPAACGLIISVLTTTSLCAYADDPALAEVLFHEGKQLMDKGELAAACAKFHASIEAEQSVGGMLNLARCHQRQGKLASAWAEYRKAATLAAKVDDEARRAGAARLARELEPKLSWLTLEVHDENAGLTVRRNGQVVPQAGLGSAFPVDPGVHRIEATAPGKAPWVEEITISSHADRHKLVVPALADAPAPRTDRGYAASERSGSSPGGDDDSGLGPLRVAGIVLGTSGAAALGVGIGLGVHALERRDALDAECPERARCVDGAARADAIRPYAHGATLGVVLGAAAVVAGTTLILLGGDESSAMVVPAGGPKTAGATLIGRF